MEEEITRKRNLPIKKDVLIKFQAIFFYFRINFIRNGKAYYADSRDKTLFYSIHRLNHFPINFKITKYDWRIYTKNRKENIKPQT